MNNLKEPIIYELDQFNSSEILRLQQQGHQILCPVCGSELLILRTHQEAAEKYTGRPGIFCPQSEAHLAVFFWLNKRRKELWRSFEEKQKERAEKSEKEEPLVQ